LIYIPACKHEGKCIPFGGTIKEVCDTFICSYDDKSMGYELMLQSQGLYAEDNVQIKLHTINQHIDNLCLIMVLVQNTYLSEGRGGLAKNILLLHYPISHICIY
jgi:hypothetical protein